MIGDTVESPKWSAPAYTIIARNFLPEGMFRVRQYCSSFYALGKFVDEDVTDRHSIGN